MLAGQRASGWCLAQRNGETWLAIVALDAGGTGRFVAELVQEVGILARSWKTSLTGAAAATLCLLPLSTPRRSTEAARTGGP